MSLALRFWGVRGSVPAPGPATAGYGGNTPCVEVTGRDGRRLLLDAGTGIVPFGRSLDPERLPERLHVLVTHGHADHVQGLPFFMPFAAGRLALTLHTAPGCRDDVWTAVRALLAPPLFPDGPSLSQRVAIEPLAGAATDTLVAGFAVRVVEAAHPGGAAGFRVADADGGPAAVYLSDNELGALEGVDGGRRAMLQAVAGASLLVHDATYLPAELPARRGWGHSSYAEAIRLAADAGVPRLVLFHHDAERDDATLDQLQQLAARIGAAAGVEVTTAREGEAVTV